MSEDGFLLQLVDPIFVYLKEGICMKSRLELTFGNSLAEIQTRIFDFILASLMVLPTSINSSKSFVSASFVP